VSEARISLVALELDALREAAMIASARAARALSDVTGRQVWMTSPKVHWTPGPWEEFGPERAREAMVAVASAVRGALAGSIIFLASATTACSLARLMLGVDCAAQDPSEPLVRSCVVEAANILGGTYLTALAVLTGGKFSVSAPTVACIPETELWQGMERSGEWPVAGLCLETELSVDGRSGALPCRHYLLGDHGAFVGVLGDLKAWS